MHPELTTLLLFGVATAFSPGPNNIMTSYSSFNFGFKKTIPTMLGVISGWTLLIIFLQAGSVVIFQKFENLQLIIKIIGSIYLLYMAYKLSFLKSSSGQSIIKPVTFLNTFFLYK